MLTVDCKDVLAIQNDLVVFVSDEIAAIPTLKNHQFTLSTLDDDYIDTEKVVSAIKQFLESIGEEKNFAVISNDDLISIKSIFGKSIEKESVNQVEMFSCSHCGFVTQYQIELDVHMRIHYL